jgi:outer membrane protein assembly factor BamB
MGENWFWAEPVIFNDAIYAPCLDGNVYALRVANGDKVTEFDLRSPVSSKPVVVDGSVIFATRKGVVYSLAAGTDKIVQLADFEQDVDGPLTAHEGIIYIHTPDLTLQRINAINGAILRPISLASQN